jgi:hypothetical protein
MTADTADVVPEDHSFHDSSDCPHRTGITSYDDLPAVAFPRRCNWCTEHDRPISPTRPGLGSPGLRLRAVSPRPAETKLSRLPKT